MKNALKAYLKVKQILDPLAVEDRNQIIECLIDDVYIEVNAPSEPAPLETAPAYPPQFPRKRKSMGLEQVVRKHIPEYSVFSLKYMIDRVSEDGYKTTNQQGLPHAVRGCLSRLKAAGALQYMPGGEYKKI